MRELFHFIFVGFLGLSVCGYGQTTPPGTLENTPLFFPASSLTTNAGNLQVTSVSSTSQHGGSVSLVTTQAWARRYNGPGNYWDGAFVLGVDARGNCAVSGNSSGGLSTAYDIATILYANDGTPLWTNRYDGPAHNNESVRGLAIDSAGNVYVAGVSRSSPSIEDAVIIKYAANGLPLWTNRFNYTGTNDNDLQTLAVDQSSNVFILVTTFDVEVGYLTLKYDAFGHAVWTNRYNPRADGSEFPSALSPDDAGNVFVTGNSDGDGTGTDFLTLKYSSTGIALWTNRYHRTFSDYARTLHVDKMGNVIVAGEVDGSTINYAAVKYGSDGTALWTNVVAGPNYSGGAVPQLQSDPAGNIFFIVGSPGATIGQLDFTTLKISPDGVPLWTNRFSPKNISLGYLSGTAVDNAGRLYFTGQATRTNGSDADFLLVRFERNGLPAWIYNLDGNGQDDFGQSIALSDAGEVFVTGLSSGLSTGEDYMTAKYADYVSYIPPTNFFGTDAFSFTFVDRSGTVHTTSVDVVIQPPLRFNTTATNLQFTPIGFHLQVDAASGSNPVILYASTNLVDWQFLQSGDAPQGMLQYTDPAALNLPRRFYRAVRQQ